jgi:hypothetical protein
LDSEQFPNVLKKGNAAANQRSNRTSGREKGACAIRLELGKQLASSWQQNAIKLLTVNKQEEAQKEQHWMRTTEVHFFNSKQRLIATKPLITFKKFK